MSAPAESLLRPRSPSRGAAIRDVSLPDAASQNGKEAGYCLVDDGGTWRQIRLRGDARLWEWPGIFERLVRTPAARKRAGCALPPARPPAPRRRQARPADLRAIDLGAGNGWMGEELVVARHARWSSGSMRSTAAAIAAERDHPDVYQSYLVLDMRRLSEGAARRPDELRLQLPGLRRRARRRRARARTPSPKRSTCSRPTAGWPST